MRNLILQITILVSHNVLHATSESILHVVYDVHTLTLPGLKIAIIYERARFWDNNRIFDIDRNIQ